MSQRLQNTFRKLQQQKQGALVTFVTAGDPTIEGSAALIQLLSEAGTDVVELGIPYSDPLADGPSIQASSQRALDRGMTPDKSLEIVRDVRQNCEVPIVLMTSYNLVLRYGLDRFARAAASAGADGVILTDLPPEEATPWKQCADLHGLATIFLIAPTSTPERVKVIAESATGFVYCVSRTGVTGARRELPPELSQTIGLIRQSTDKPICVGFGVSTPEHVAQVVALADGAVIGSALVDYLHTHQTNGDTELRALVRTWKMATRHRS